MNTKEYTVEQADGPYWVVRCGKKMLQKNLMTGKVRWVYRVTSVDCTECFESKDEA